MKHLTYFLLSLSIIFFSSCEDDDCFNSLSSVTTESRTTGDFSKISFDGVGQVIVTQGNTRSVSVETHSELIPLIETSVVNDELLVDMDFCTNNANIDELTIHVTTSDITSLKILGVGNIEVQNSIEVDELDITIEGVGKVEVGGTANVLNIFSEGVGKIEAFELIAKECNVLLEGTGNAEVYAEETLDVTLSGAGSVYYKGNPDITQTIQGVGSVVDAN